MTIELSVSDVRAALLRAGDAGRVPQHPLTDPAQAALTVGG